MKTNTKFKPLSKEDHGKYCRVAKSQMESKVTTSEISCGLSSFKFPIKHIENN